ncbi:MAG: outer membrane lipoprotein-sorting protein [Prolixibacteraceae bacterium]|nr:outer membrane lipoprotein-sorting protein [Prolixibacteraceae bacterium]
MKQIINIMVAFLLVVPSMAQPTANDLLKKIDQNLSSKNRVFESEMTIHGKRASRTVVSKTYSVGDKQAFTEYLSPAREQGTKMLKLENQLWIYSPSTDRTIQISGHMLRQSVMGSDLSYEDMMDDRKLTEIYDGQVLRTETLDDRTCYVVELIANVSDVAYHKRLMWVDAERFVPLKEELYAKSGQLLKQTVMSEVLKIQGRWFPTKMVYKDMLKQGDGTEFKVLNASFDQDIPDYLFTKAALKQ